VIKLADSAADITVDTEMVLQRFPDVRLDHDNIFFYAGLLGNRLLLNRCANCGLWHTPPRPICPRCWSEDLRATPVSGNGVVYSYTRLSIGPAIPEVDYATPYAVVVVDLAEQEGLRFSGPYIADSQRPLPEVGLPVRLTWTPLRGNPHPAFAPQTGVVR
jgi:uncharacterized OB-fold protein